MGDLKPNKGVLITESARRKGLVDRSSLNVEVVRRVHKAPRADREKDEAETIATDQKEVLAKKPDGRLKWLRSALQRASRGQFKVNLVYDIVAHPKFVAGCTAGMGRHMRSLVFANLSQFSTKQQKFLQSEASKLHAFAGGDADGGLNAGSDKDDEEDENAEKEDREEKEETGQAGALGPTKTTLGSFWTQKKNDTIQMLQSAFDEADAREGVPAGEAEAALAPENGGDPAVGHGGAAGAMEPGNSAKAGTKVPLATAILAGETATRRKKRSQRDRDSRSSSSRSRSRSATPRKRHASRRPRESRRSRSGQRGQRHGPPAQPNDGPPDDRGRDRKGGGGHTPPRSGAAPRRRGRGRRSRSRSRSHSRRHADRDRSRSRGGARGVANGKKRVTPAT